MKLEYSAMTTKLPFLIAAVLAVAFWRIIPHPPNVTPVMAMALFAGCYFADKKVAYLVPLLAMLVADLVIGLHSSMLFVYAGVALTVFVGNDWLSRKADGLRVIVATVGCSLLFFLLTNFGAWLVSEAVYPRSAAGLMQAYVAGIPFYKNSVLGDLFFSAVLFGGYYLARLSVGESIKQS